MLPPLLGRCWSGGGDVRGAARHQGLFGPLGFLVPVVGLCAASASASPTRRADFVTLWRLHKWAVLGGRFGQPSGICWGLDGDGPRFRPPEGSFVNFFAKMANTVLRCRCANFVPCHIGRATRPSTRIALPTRQEGLMRLMMAWAHDWRCIPSSLANKIPGASICRGTFLRENIVPPAVTTSPIDRPFDRRGRHRQKNRKNAKPL